MGRGKDGEEKKLRRILSPAVVKAEGPFSSPHSAIDNQQTHLKDTASEAIGRQLGTSAAVDQGLANIALHADGRRAKGRDEGEMRRISGNADCGCAGAGHAKDSCGGSGSCRGQRRTDLLEVSRGLDVVPLLLGHHIDDFLLAALLAALAELFVLAHGHGW